jgi:hypothetical protein
VRDHTHDTHTTHTAKEIQSRGEVVHVRAEAVERSHGAARGQPSSQETELGVAHRRSLRTFGVNACVRVRGLRSVTVTQHTCTHMHRLCAQTNEHESGRAEPHQRARRSPPPCASHRPGRASSTRKRVHCSRRTRTPHTSHTPHTASSVRMQHTPLWREVEVVTGGRARRRRCRRGRTVARARGRPCRSP